MTYQGDVIIKLQINIGHPALWRGEKTSDGRRRERLSPASGR